MALHIWFTIPIISIGVHLLLNLEAEVLQAHFLTIHFQVEVKERLLLKVLLAQLQLPSEPLL